MLLLGVFLDHFHMGQVYIFERKSLGSVPFRDLVK